MKENLTGEQARLRRTWLQDMGETLAGKDREIARLEARNLENKEELAVKDREIVGRQAEVETQQRVQPKPAPRNLKAETRNSKVESLNPKPETRNWNP